MSKKKHTIPDEKFKRILAFDPLDTAEKMTGKDSQEDEATTWLGMFMMWENHDHKKAAALERNDTYWAMPLNEYLRAIKLEGFKQVLALPFIGKSKEDPPINETLYAFWKASEGLFLKFDTFRGKLNGGTCYFNLEVPVETYIPGGYSGHWRDGVLIADIDCREALRFKLNQFREVGKFLPAWKERPYFSLSHYMDVRDEDGESIPWEKEDGTHNREQWDAVWARQKVRSEERVRMLPLAVQECICPRKLLPAPKD